MAKQQKTFVDEETKQAAKELDEAAAAITKELGEVKITESNGSDFEKLMAKDVVLRPEIQDILTKSGGQVRPAQHRPASRIQKIPVCQNWRIADSSAGGLNTHKERT